ncbi:flippase-like domain-containing protein [Marivirga sp. S37H4]|uniref:Flippase-like domain-containing protein n=1 Tax=Marivirga aurantiaca TaxID=2802615 RepID=A0A934X0M6_9BACT|nr:lysylphosphatidylglycerol synthase domain-containing protein [Marivirga aurantiaca]MBK6266316.1 flippase-like domain-containing protein [Marivirga aurantiaca]
MRKPLLFLLKIIISLAIFAFLFYRIASDKTSFSEALQGYHNNLPIILVVLLLMPLNWAMEVFKWKLCISPLVKITFKQAIAGVLSGVALGFVTPRAVGDYFAKVWSIQHEDRKKALGPILVARMSQMLPTLIFGIFSVKIFLDKSGSMLYFPTGYTPILIIVGGFLLLLLLIFLFFNYGKKKKHLIYYFDLIRELKLGIVVQLFGLSIVRYIVFSIQFLLLLSIFSFPLSLADQFMGISFMFLAKSVLPTFNVFNDLGVREFSAVLYFEAFGVASAPIILAGLILWLINIAVPALIGLFFIQRFRIDPS